MMHTITVTGLRAAAIIQANSASFYGINSLSATSPAIIAGQIAARAAVRDYLASAGIPWNAFDIVGAETIDTNGTPTPYAAKVAFTVV